ARRLTKLARQSPPQPSPASGGGSTPPRGGRVGAKVRADQLLFEQGLAESRAKAQALILAGLVFSGGKRIDKPGTALPPETALSGWRRCCRRRSPSPRNTPRCSR